MINPKDGESVAFVGDSIIDNGVFLNYLRQSAEASGRKIAFFNKGIPGYRMEIAGKPLDEEFSLFVPDYAVICYGINDIGIWLYDARKEETGELLQKREARMRTYFDALPALVAQIKGYGIRPILASPFCVNERLDENENIETVTDNREKRENADEIAYERKTFRRINAGLRRMRDFLADYAKENALDFLDFYSDSLRNMTSGMFAEDGVHLLPDGHRQLARYLLREMNIPFDDSPICEKYEELRQLELRERGYLFIKYGFFLDGYRDMSMEEMHEKIDRFVMEKGYVDGVSETRKAGFDAFYADRENRLKPELLRRILSAAQFPNG